MSTAGRSENSSNPEGDLIWAVKTSLFRYVKTAGGAVDATDGALIAGEAVRFMKGPTPTGYVGTVRFRAHDGAINWTIASPEVDFAAETLFVRDGNDRRVAFAHLDPGGEVHLADDGVRLLGGMYPNGTQLDDLRWDQG